jgi:hypothetical protein
MIAIHLRFRFKSSLTEAQKDAGLTGRRAIPIACAG